MVVKWWHVDGFHLDRSPVTTITLDEYTLQCKFGHGLLTAEVWEYSIDQSHRLVRVVIGERHLIEQFFVAAKHFSYFDQVLSIESRNRKLSDAFTAMSDDLRVSLNHHISSLERLVQVTESRTIVKEELIAEQAEHIAALRQIIDMLEVRLSGRRSTEKRPRRPTTIRGDANEKS